MSDRERLIDQIMAAQQRLQRLSAQDRSDPLFASQLTIPQLRILLAVSGEGGTTGSELAARFGVSLATVTGMVDRLVAHGLVTRREDPHDRRVRRIELTVAGDRLITGIITAGAERHRRLLGRLDPAQLRVIAEAMDLLVRAADL